MPETPEKFDSYAEGLLAIYGIERGDQQTSGNQSRALLGTGLAYAAAAAVLLNKGSVGEGGVATVLIMAAPLPLVALISLLILGVGNIQQRAKYLIALERELEPYMSLADEKGGWLLTVPNGFRRSEYVFAPPGAATPESSTGASKRLRSVASILMGVLTHGAMLAVEAGLVIYSATLVSGWQVVAVAVFYGLSIAAQVLGWIVALRPGSWQ